MSNHKSRATVLAAGLFYEQPGTLDQPNMTETCLGVCFERKFYSIPLHSSLQRSRCWRIISLDFKIYILGGNDRNDPEMATSEVYSFHLVTQNWTRCADMRRSRTGFGIGTLNGKIYVLGGSHLGIPMVEAEVYDPAVNVWSSIADMMELRTNPRVAIVRNFLIVYGGAIHKTDAESDRDSLNSDTDRDSDSPDWKEDGGYIDVSQPAIWAWAYHTQQNKWMKVNHADGGYAIFADNEFAMKGACCRFTKSGDAIKIYDIFKKSWRTLRNFVGWFDQRNDCFNNDLPDPLDLGLGRGQALMIDGELLTVGHLTNDPTWGAVHVLQTSGFDEKEVLGLEVLADFPDELEQQQQSTVLFPLDM